MNPRFQMPLHPYPFEKLRALLAWPRRRTGLPPSICRSANPSTPRRSAGHPGRHGGLSVYPSTKGDPALRRAISRGWRAATASPPPTRNPGAARAGLARSAVLHPDGDDPSAGAVVVCPNPFSTRSTKARRCWQAARPFYVNADAARNFGCDWNQVPEDIWRKTRLVFVCSPGNPAGNVMSLEEWKTLFQLSDRHGFAIASSDECYSGDLPGRRQSAAGRLRRPRAVWAATTTATWWRSPAPVPRSNVPGLRSGLPGTRR